MDSWLTNEVKELLFSPCFSASEMAAAKLENRMGWGQEMDERALVEMLVDAFDTRSPQNAWGMARTILNDHNVFIDTHVTKATREYATGADIGIIINRRFSRGELPSEAEYAVLIQCKKIDSGGTVPDFLHAVRSSGRRQSSLMLDITPSSFYFIFTPPSLLQSYCALEPIGFVQPASGCSCPVWNVGAFGFDHQSIPFLSLTHKAQATGILVVPALAVDALQVKARQLSISQILPNCLPLWYWFGELLIPGFIGDRRAGTIAAARNKIADEDGFGVRYTMTVSLGTG